jgi:hypothetical protein
LPDRVGPGRADDANHFIGKPFDSRRAIEEERRYMNGNQKQWRDSKDGVIGKRSGKGEGVGVKPTVHDIPDKSNEPVHEEAIRTLSAELLAAIEVPARNSLGRM